MAIDITTITGWLQTEGPISGWLQMKNKKNWMAKDEKTTLVNIQKTSS